MTPIEKCQPFALPCLLTAMLMQWLPMARSQQEMFPAWFNPWPEDNWQYGLAVVSGAFQASAQTTCKGRYSFHSAPSLEVWRETGGSFAHPGPGRIALGRSSERNRWGPLGLSQS